MELNKSIFYLFIAQLIFIITGYIIHIFLGRYLGPEDYGIYGVIISLMTMISLLLTTGIPTAVSKFISENIQDSENIKNKAFKLQLLISLFISVIYYLSAGSIAFLLNDALLINYIKTSTLIFPIYGVFYIYLNYFNGLQEFKKQSILLSIYSFSKLVLIIFLVLMFEIYGAIIGFIIAPLIALLFVLLIKKIEIPIKKTEVNINNDDIFKRILNFAFPIIIFSFLLNFLINIDLLFVKAYLSDQKTGLYTVSSILSKFIYLLSIFVPNFLFPILSNTMTLKNLEKTRNLIMESIRFAFIFLIPIIFYVSLRAKDLILIFYGQKYFYAWESFTILTISIGMIILFLIFSTIINASGDPKKPMFIIALGLIISLFLNYFLVPIYELNGAAFSTFISGAIILLISTIYIKRRFNLRMRFKSFINIILSIILSSLILIPSIFIDNEYYTILEGIIFFLVYFSLLIFIFKELTRKDLILILGSHFLNKTKFISKLFEEDF